MVGEKSVIVFGYRELVGIIEIIVIRILGIEVFKIVIFLVCFVDEVGLLILVWGGCWGVLVLLCFIESDELEVNILLVKVVFILVFKFDFFI